MCRAGDGSMACPLSSLGTKVSLIALRAVVESPVGIEVHDYVSRWRWVDGLPTLVPWNQGLADRLGVECRSHDPGVVRQHPMSREIGFEAIERPGGDRLEYNQVERHWPSLSRVARCHLICNRTEHPQPNKLKRRRISKAPTTSRSICAAPTKGRGYILTKPTSVVDVAAGARGALRLRDPSVGPWLVC